MQSSTVRRRALRLITDSVTATPEGLYRHVRAYLSESHEFWSDTSQDGVEPDDALVDWGDTFRCCLDGQIVAKPVEEPSH